ncbi:MAG: acyl-CoA thioesterase [Bacteriovoracaceae bacterium]|nr:acyl-CoA thioesterase [Bacteriovoracaceae bacterium]
MKPIFSYPITVQQKDIDSLRHVNNEVYLRWTLEAANAHSVSLGYGMEKFLSDGACFVVRRHELDYLLPAYLGEELIVETWIKTMNAAKSIRAYQIKRKSDEKIILKAETLWVYINLSNGRPMEIPEKMAADYSAFLH